MSKRGWRGVRQAEGEGVKRGRDILYGSIFSVWDLLLWKYMCMISRREGTILKTLWYECLVVSTPYCTVPSKGVPMQTFMNM